MKRFAMIVFAAGMAIGSIGIANAQHGGHMGGGGMGAGGWHGGSMGGWHGGSNGWHGGSWHGHDGHTHVVFGFGFGVGWPYWGWGWPYYYPYYYPYSYYPYSSYYYPYYSGYGYPAYDSGYSGDYIEQGSGGGYDPSTGAGYGAGGGYGPESAPPPAQPRPQFSYYCPDPAGYYPQVATCSKGWLRVVPQNVPGPTSPVH